MSSENYFAQIQNIIHQIELELHNIANLFYIINNADITRTITALYHYGYSVLKVTIDAQKHASNISDAINHIITQYTISNYFIA